MYIYTYKYTIDLMGVCIAFNENNLLDIRHVLFVGYVWSDY